MYNDYVYMTVTYEQFWRQNKDLSNRKL